jgi:hypothetical protein
LGWASNPELQTAAQERFGLAAQLLAALQTDDVIAHPAHAKRYLFALSALVRGHVAATRAFVDVGGGAVLERLAQTAVHADVRRRAVILATDLLTDARLHGTCAHETVHAGRWCAPAAALLHEPHVASIDHAVQALGVLQPTCGHPPAAAVAAALSTLDALAARDSDDDDSHLHGLRAALAPMHQPSS